jgi:hypothetical protein
MREIFIGELSRLKLFDILKTLLVEKKTGVLTIQGKQTGEICLEGGNIVHSKTPHCTGEEAFLTITGWRIGKASFKLDVPSKEKTITIPAEQLLLKWSYRKQEWDKIREVVPTPNVIFRLSLKRNSEERSIRPDEWNVLALSNGMKPVSEIGETLGWTEFKTCRTICQLVQAGLLEKAEERRLTKQKRVGENFFPRLEHELKRAMGPVAPFIIDDKLAEFAETRDFFPQAEAEFFVDALGEEIPSDPKRKEFLKAMMAFLSSQS